MSRPSTPLISRDKAVAMAIELIERDGLDAFSLPKLARAMNVKTPSLYHHFESKRDLAASIAATIIRETMIPERPADLSRWQDWFVELAFNFREVVQRYQATALLLLEFIPRDAFLPVYDECAALLADARVPADVHLQVLDGLETVVYGATLADAVQNQPSGGIETLPVDPDSHPHLAAAIAANQLTAEELLEAKVRSFLLGVLSLHAASSNLPRHTRRTRAGTARRVSR